MAIVGTAANASGCSKMSSLWPTGERNLKWSDLREHMTPCTCIYPHVKKKFYMASAISIYFLYQPTLCTWFLPGHTQCLPRGHAGHAQAPQPAQPPPRRV